MANSRTSLKIHYGVGGNEEVLRPGGLETPWANKTADLLGGSLKVRFVMYITYFCVDVSFLALNLACYCRYEVRLYLSFKSC